MADFVEITEDPYTNKTSKYLVVTEIKAFSPPQPASGSWVNVYYGLVADPQGVECGFFRFIGIFESSIASAPITAVVTERQNQIVPPGFTLSAFTVAIGFYVTPEELPEWL